MQRIADRSIANDRRQRIQPMTREYCLSCFRDNSSASLLQNVVASRAIPPVVERTSGVKTPCSTSRTLWAYSLFFAVSCLRYAAAVVIERLLDALGWKTLTSKNASWPVFQKPRARISRRVLASVFAVR